MSTNSCVEQVEYSKHALQLMSLENSAASAIQKQESPTNGRNRKKRRMKQAQEAAENMESSSLASASPDSKSNGTLSGDAKNTQISETPPSAFNDESVEQRNGKKHKIDKTFDPGETEERDSTQGRSTRQRSRRQASLRANREKTIIEQSYSTPVPAKKQSKQSEKAKSFNKDNVPGGTGEFVEEHMIQDRDVLVGRGLKTHPGNERYRELVISYNLQMGERTKEDIAEEIADQLLNDGARFLKKVDEGRWEIQERETVIIKAERALHDLKGTKGKRKSARPVKRKAPQKSPIKRKVPQKVQDSEKLISPSSSRRKRSKPTEKENTDSTTNRQQRSTPDEPTCEEYDYKHDPNQYYVEETAYLYHNPPFPSKSTSGVKIEDLRGVPPPPPLPELPQNETCNWSHDEKSRVIIADFSVNSGNTPLVTEENSKFLFEMQERTDITVISRGLLNLDKMDPDMWHANYLKKVVGQEFYHKFRRFDRTIDKNGIETYEEKDSLFSMRFGDYVDYCEQRKTFLANKAEVSLDQQDEPTFEFEDHMGNMHSVGIATSALYMIDVDIKRLTPLLNKNFLDSFELPAVLPGGSHCMMNSVTPDAQPFMGPNFYMTPPASFTHFHQDGHGTVDSGHLCISGYNEVIMLRRLTERHKKHALWILSGKQRGGSHFDGLYSMPHGDNLGKKPPWPNTDMIKECEEKGYCPSVFTLTPGDLVHINKGRLHAFRKMSTSKLREADCHAEIRRKVIEERKMDGQENLCISVAWDWMYRGVTPEGINREVSTVLEASVLNRRNGVSSLAIPELSLLQMAKSVPAKTLSSREGISFLDALQKNTCLEEKKKKSVYEATKKEICKGIYPALCVVVGQHVRALNVEESTSMERGKHLTISKIPDTQENPQTCPLDPYGDSDFQCKFCSKELCNVYFHCDGCERLLSKDFNICGDCYFAKKFRCTVTMHPTETKRHATLQHTGNPQFNRASRCVCKNGPQCKHCGFCLGCSCRCHTYFTVRTRLCNAVDETKLWQSVKDTADVKSRMQSITAEGGTGLIDITDEPTKHLCNRLKGAGDEEWLSVETNVGTKPNEENGQSLPNGIKQEEKDNHESVNGKTAEETKPYENSDNLLLTSTKIEQVSEDEACNNQDESRASTTKNEILV